MNLIVVEGIGDIINKPGGYGPSLQKLKIDIPTLRVVFCDLSSEWRDSQIRKNRRSTIRWLTRWGAEFLDKSKPSQLKEYDSLLEANVDAVIIAVPDSAHIMLAKYWLTGNCKRVLIEKPITNNLSEAQEWLTNDLYNSPDNLSRVIAFDHYRPRVHDRLCHRENLWFLLREIGKISKFRFYFLEDHSGTDTRFLTQLQNRGIQVVDRNGPIEIESRVDALRSGLILDMMSHVIAVLEYFGAPESIQYKQLYPAIYTGVDYDYSRRATIETETFAAVRFTFDADTGNQAEGEAFIGKGIRGSDKYQQMGGNVKVLEIEGDTGNKLEINFREHVINTIRGGQRFFFQHLERDPYYFLLQDIAFKPEKGTTVGLSPEMATMILEKLMIVKAKINNEKLQTYKLGDRTTGRPPLLEALLAEIPPVIFELPNLSE